MTTPPHAISDYPMLVVEGHLDTFGHMNNATYLQIFEAARWETVTSRGYGLAYVQQTGLGPTILEINMKFLRELRLRVNINVRTQLQSYEGKIGKLRQWIEDDQRRLCCDAILTFGLFDVRLRKLALPTPEWLRAIGAATTPTA